MPTIRKNQNFQCAEDSPYSRETGFSEEYYIYLEIIMFFSFSFTKWWHKVAFFSKGAIFISVLIAAQGLVEYGLLVTFITYLTEYGKMELAMAAITMNVYEGLSSLLVIVVAQLSESYFGRLKGILYTNVTFILGLIMLWCAVKFQNIEVLFGALVMLTFGKAGRDITLKAFLADQLWSCKDQESNFRRDEQLPQTCGNNNDDESSVIPQVRSGEDNENVMINPGMKQDDFEEVIETRQKFYWRFSWIFGIIVATLWLSSKDWLRIIEISTIAMIAGVSVFLFGIPFYIRNNPSPSPLRYIFKVVKVALSKRNLDYPVSPSQLFKNCTSDTEILPHIAFLRWLDKAAILEASPPCPVSTTEELAETEGGRVFEVAKVKDVKRLISMCSLWSTFYVSSLVGATADTFFYEQAGSMDDSLGKLPHVPIVVFVIIMTFTSSITLIICSWLKNRSINARRPPLNRIRLGMLCSVLCCLTAWRVEVYRRDDLEERIDNNGKIIYDNLISVFWLTPQFFLVGLMQGLSESGLQDFFETQVCESMKGYGPQFSEFATGIGKLFSAICILIFVFWFGEDVNTSRLDKYYRMLLVPTILNLCFCYLVSKWYANQPHDHIETIDIVQELKDGVIEVMTNENSSFDIVQGLEDGAREVVINENPALRLLKN